MTTTPSSDRARGARRRPLREVPVDQAGAGGPRMRGCRNLRRLRRCSRRQRPDDGADRLRPRVPVAGVNLTAIGAAPVLRRIATRRLASEGRGRCARRAERRPDRRHEHPGRRHRPLRPEHLLPAEHLVLRAAQVLRRELKRAHWSLRRGVSGLRRRQGDPRPPSGSDGYEWEVGVRRDPRQPVDLTGARRRRPDLTHHGPHASSLPASRRRLLTRLAGRGHCGEARG